jgi:hypothetical protein
LSTAKIYVFCNTLNCDRGAGDWHSMLAVAEDGHVLAAHICSHHGFAQRDMGIHPDGWKRDKYAAHYPAGFEVLFIESKDINTHPGLQAAFAAARALDEPKGGSL